jgi:hypothetical protein
MNPQKSINGSENDNMISQNAFTFSNHGQGIDTPTIFKHNQVFYKAPKKDWDYCLGKCPTERIVDIVVMPFNILLVVWDHLLDYKRTIKYSVQGYNIEQGNLCFEYFFTLLNRPNIYKGNDLKVHQTPFHEKIIITNTNGDIFLFEILNNLSGNLIPCHLNEHFHNCSDLQMKTYDYVRSISGFPEFYFHPDKPSFIGVKVEFCISVVGDVSEYGEPINNMEIKYNRNFQVIIDWKGKLLKATSRCDMQQFVDDFELILTQTVDDLPIVLNSPLIIVLKKDQKCMCVMSSMYSNGVIKLSIGLSIILIKPTKSGYCEKISNFQGYPFCFQINGFTSIINCGENLEIEDHFGCPDELYLQEWIQSIDFRRNK